MRSLLNPSIGWLFSSINQHIQLFNHVSRITYHVSRDNDTAMLLAEVIVTSYPTVQTIYTIWYNFDTVLYQFLETGTSDRRLIGIV